MDDFICVYEIFFVILCDFWGEVEIRKTGILENWNSGDLEIWKSGNPEYWKSGKQTRQQTTNIS